MEIEQIVNFLEDSNYMKIQFEDSISTVYILGQNIQKESDKKSFKPNEVFMDNFLCQNFPILPKCTLLMH